MIKRAFWVLLGVLAILAGAGIGWIALQAAPGITVSLAANPVMFKGDCPAQITLTVGFKVTGPCAIKYNFVTDKGQPSGPGILNCLAAGSYKAVKIITLTDSFSGWMAVQVTSPIALQSNAVSLEIKCKPKPAITSAKLNYGGEPIPEMDIIGTNFGLTQGSKNVQIDGTLITSKPGWGMVHWGNTTLTINTSGLTPWEHTYQIAVTQGNTVVSNIYSAKFLYTIDGVSPDSGAAGSTVQVSVWNLPPSQDSYNLDVGGQYMEIVSWGGGVIGAKVPANAPPGLQNIRMSKGNDTVSNLVPFTVNTQPTINNADWATCPNIMLVVYIAGAHFGASQGTKQVKIGTLAGWAVSHWSDDYIEVQGPLNLVPWYQPYLLSIVEGSQTVSNTLQKRFPFWPKLEGVTGNPVQVQAGSTLNISVYGLPATQGTRVLKFGSTPLEVLSWQSPNIQVRVPNLPGVGAELNMYDGNALLSSGHGSYFVII